MDKQKFLERLNEALVRIEVDIKLIAVSILDNVTDKEITRTMKKLLKDHAKQAESLKRLNGYVLEEADKNEL